ncbi:hypothetical protein PM082_015648 [Marasmius tenuissimus]|nr:hypothetical protein PM082_015648 [Marasmius tenuissimus]
MGGGEDMNQEKCGGRLTLRRLEQLSRPSFGDARGASTPRVFPLKATETQRRSRSIEEFKIM